MGKTFKDRKKNFHNSFEDNQSSSFKKKKNKPKTWSREKENDQLTELNQMNQFGHLLKKPN